MGKKGPLSPRTGGRSKRKKAVVERIPPEKEKKITQLKRSVQNGTYVVDERAIAAKLLKEILQDVLSSGTR